MKKDLHFDFDRLERIGLPEAVLCQGKSVQQLENILAELLENETVALLTRLDESSHASISRKFDLDYDPVSRTAFLGKPLSASSKSDVAVVAAGTSDLPVAAEAMRTLEFHGQQPRLICDIGVAGLWRLNKYLDTLKGCDALIVVAGMDGALPSVVGGLVGSLVIAVPSSTGYGVANKGQTALNAALSSCAPGVVVVNIDNGYGAAIACLRACRSNGS